MSLLTGWFRESIAPYLSLFKSEILLGQVESQTINITDWVHFKSIVENLEGKTLLGEVILQLPAGDLTADSDVSFRNIQCTLSSKGLHIKGDALGTTVIRYGTAAPSGLLKFRNSSVSFEHITIDGMNSNKSFFEIRDSSRINMRSSTNKLINSRSSAICSVTDSFLDAGRIEANNIFGLLSATNSQVDLHRANIVIGTGSISGNVNLVRVVHGSRVTMTHLTMVDSNYRMHCAVRVFFSGSVNADNATLQAKRGIMASSYATVYASRVVLDSRDFGMMAYSGAYVYSLRPNSTLSVSNGIRHFHVDGAMMYIRGGTYANKQLGSCHNLAEMRFRTDGVATLTGLDDPSININNFSKLLCRDVAILSNVALGTIDPARGVRVA